jgi:SAM-dependent methyltransferase
VGVRDVANSWPCLVSEQRTLRRRFGRRKEGCSFDDHGKVVWLRLPQVRVPALRSAAVQGCYKTPATRLCESPGVFSHSAEIYDAVYAFKDYEAEAGRLHAFIAERSPEASTLLDVACGTGRHLEYLRAWYEVSGLDLDGQLIEIARGRLGDVPLVVRDMASFDLGRRFDVVTCLFSSIGYVGTLERLSQAVAAMGAHLRPGGVLIVEPWLPPDAWETNRPHLLTVDEPDLKIARMTIQGREGRLAVMNFTYLVGTPDGLQEFSERHEAALFTDREYRDAFTAAGLTVDHDEHGLIGRGLYIAQHV